MRRSHLEPQDVEYLLTYIHNNAYQFGLKYFLDGNSYFCTLEFSQDIHEIFKVSKIKGKACISSSNKVAKRFSDAEAKRKQKVTGTE